MGNQTDKDRDYSKLLKGPLLSLGLLMLMSIIYSLSVYKETVSERPVQLNRRAPLPIAMDIAPLPVAMDTPSRERKRFISAEEYQRRLMICSNISQTEVEGMRQMGRESLSDKNVPPAFLPNYKNPCWYEKKGKKDRLRCMPYFYLAGMGKCGTTDLHSSLGTHPSILTKGKVVKEISFWEYRSTKMPFEHYLAIFNRAAIEIEAVSEDNYHPLIISDATPRTAGGFVHDGWPLLPGNQGHWEPVNVAADMIRKFTPQAKFVIIVRNPADMMFSYYMFRGVKMHYPGQVIRKRPDTESLLPEFHKYVVQAIKDYSQCFERRGVRQCAYDLCMDAFVNDKAYKADDYYATANTSFHSRLATRSGLYIVFIRNILKVFPREQLIVVRLEDYARDRLSVLNQIFRFLDLEELPSFLAEELTKKAAANPTSSKNITGVTEMWKKTRALLEEFYRPFNEQLAALLEDDRLLWLHSN